MRKVSLQNCPPMPRPDEFIMQPLFGPETKPGETMHMGYAVFKPGLRVPAEGESVHDGDEFSYFISGNLKTVCKGVTHEMKAGDAVYVPAGEPHYSYNDGDEDCTLIYFLVKDGGKG